MPVPSGYQQQSQQLHFGLSIFSVFIVHIIYDVCLYLFSVSASQINKLRLFYDFDLKLINCGFLDDFDLKLINCGFFDDFDLKLSLPLISAYIYLICDDLEIC